MFICCYTSNTNYFCFDLYVYIFIETCINTQNLAFASDRYTKAPTLQTCKLYYLQFKCMNMTQSLFKKAIFTFFNNILRNEIIISYIRIVV